MTKEQSEKKLAILMPVKNSERYISECIESMISQEFSDWVLIAVNDHSTDSTADLILAHAEKDARIKLLQNEGEGIISALQTGFKQSSSVFISRMDADDVMPAGRLQAMVELLEKSPPKTIVSGKVRYVSDGPISAGYLEYEKWLNHRVDKHDHWNWIYRECVIASPNWMGRRNEFQDISAFENLMYPEDYDLVFKWYAANFNVRSIAGITLYWREHPERTSRNSAHYTQAYFFALKLTHFLRHDYSRNSLLLLGAGEKGKLSAAHLLEHGIGFRWMERDDRLIGQVVYGIKIEALDSSALQPPVQVLVAVYPGEKERELIATFLEKSGLRMGRQWWWL